jgi:hypothetical protein
MLLEVEKKPTPKRPNYGTVTREDGTMASLSTKKGRTRGKNPRDIEYEAFDLEKPETLPKSMKEFMEVTNTKEEKDLVELLINGFNDSQYSAASDEIGEYINDAWDKEYQAQFRLTIRNFSKIAGKTVEETVTLLKPAIDAGWEVRKATKAAEAAKPVEEKKEVAAVGA